MKNYSFLTLFFLLFISSCGDQSSKPTTQKERNPLKDTSITEKKFSIQHELQGKFHYNAYDEDPSAGKITASYGEQQLQPSEFSLVKNNFFTLENNLLTLIPAKKEDFTKLLKKSPGEKKVFTLTFKYQSHDFKFSLEVILSLPPIDPPPALISFDASTWKEHYFLEGKKLTLGKIIPTKKNLQITMDALLKKYFSYNPKSEEFFISSSQQTLLTRELEKIPQKTKTYTLSFRVKEKTFSKKITLKIAPSKGSLSWGDNWKEKYTLKKDRGLTLGKITLENLKSSDLKITPNYITYSGILKSLVISASKAHMHLKNFNQARTVQVEISYSDQKEKRTIIIEPSTHPSPVMPTLTEYGSLPSLTYQVNPSRKHAHFPEFPNLIIIRRKTSSKVFLYIQKKEISPLKLAQFTTDVATPPLYIYKHSEKTWQDFSFLEISSDHHLKITDLPGLISYLQKNVQPIKKEKRPLVYPLSLLIKKTSSWFKLSLNFLLESSAPRAITTQYPWVGYLELAYSGTYKTDDGKEFIDPRTKGCTASLIKKNIILTAKHCLTPHQSEDLEKSATAYLADKDLEKYYQSYDQVTVKTLTESKLGYALNFVLPGDPKNQRFEINLDRIEIIPESDLALITLDQNVAIELPSFTIAQQEELENLSQDITLVSMPSFTKDYDDFNATTYQKFISTCRLTGLQTFYTPFLSNLHSDFGYGGTLFDTTCASWFGGSGGIYFQEKEDGSITLYGVVSHIFSEFNAQDKDGNIYRDFRYIRDDWGDLAPTNFSPLLFAEDKINFGPEPL